MLAAADVWARAEDLGGLEDGEAHVPDLPERHVPECGEPPAHRVHDAADVWEGQAYLGGVADTSANNLSSMNGRADHTATHPATSSSRVSPPRRYATIFSLVSTSRSSPSNTDAHIHNHCSTVYASSVPHLKAVSMT